MEVCKFPSSAFMASSMVFSSFSLHSHPHLAPSSPFNLPSNSLSLNASNLPFSTYPLLPTPPIRNSFNLTPNFQTQTLTRNPPSPTPEPIGDLPEPVRSKFLSHFHKSGGFTTIGDFNDVLVSLLVANEPQFALQLYSNLPDYGLSPDGWTYSIVIRSYCKKNDPFEARKTLDLMLQGGFNPNVITFTVLIDCFCRRGRVQRAFEVFELMEKLGCEPNVQTYNCLLKGLCFVGRVEEATAMVSKMNASGEMPKPDVYSYTAVMDGLCNVGRTDEAMELLAEAIGMGLLPTVVTYNSLFNGYCKEGRPKKGLKLLKVMKERNCEPDYITYSSLLHGLLKWGFTREALWVYNGMVGMGLKVDERMMNTLLRALCRRSWANEVVPRDAYQVFDKMRSWGYQVYPNTYQLVIQTRCVGKEIDEALVGLEEMVSSGQFPRMVIINRIIRGLCEEGRVNEALSVLVTVHESRRIPSKISYNILIDEFSRRGELIGACAVYGSALKLGVTPHVKPGLAQVHR